LTVASLQAELPSEAEYGYAAAGGSQLNMYPWGITDPGSMNRYAIYDCYYPNGTTMCTGGNIARVGSAPAGAGRWGQLDLVGNIYEWMLDWYATFAPCTDCAYLTPTSGKVARGGYFDSSFYYSESSTRPNTGDMPTARYDFLGFRCARVP
jgi:formylglycine-generating enzyme required for sulfatase activity